MNQSFDLQAMFDAVEKMKSLPQPKITDVVCTQSGYLRLRAETVTAQTDTDFIGMGLLGIPVYVCDSREEAILKLADLASEGRRPKLVD